jgi:retinol dehydrogenase 12
MQNTVSMNGRICVVTGATHGVGLATARALSALGATVVVHGRDLDRARSVAEAIGGATGNREVRAVQADFAELAQVRRLAQQLTSQLPRLDLLINNAGMMSARHARSAEGYDLTFAVNHLAPFLLTNLLLGKLKSSAPARVIVVASEAHRRARLDFADLMNGSVSGLLAAYARSKLANVLFVRALAARLSGSRVTVNALHPGFVHSNLFHASPVALRWVLETLVRPFMLSPEQGARTSVYLATASEVAGESGGYYRACRRVAPSAAAQNDADAERLWRESARLTGLAA